jgi:GAF domain-containing protein
LNQLHGAAELNEFLVEEATELSGAERVLLLLADGDELRIAGALLPPAEDAAALLQAIRPWLDEARHNRLARLRHGPDGAEAVAQRSCLVAPLIAQRQVLGYLYADTTPTATCWPCWPARLPWRWPTCAPAKGWRPRWPSARLSSNSAPASWR